MSLQETALSQQRETYMLQVELTHSEQLEKLQVAAKDRFEALEDIYLKCADDAKVIGELLKKPAVCSQEEISKILERNQEQNVARTSCLQNLDQVHD
ncbi:hypothetical protein DUI87_11476 [Hirundo rustica rustica]|uniref:Uncharacterized protein n=1 Tax=Hirundo rustica rustica TaxID=333673 RepID=A0A3M0KW73_HIRRU|nr:hypothetical protein DUI87_11476 [Hirundo rustica rustica]